MHQLIHFFQRNVTLGVPFLIYLTMAFFLKLKDLIYIKRKSVFDL